MIHELRNFNKKTMVGYCLTCKGLVELQAVGTGYYCRKQTISMSMLNTSPEPKKRKQVKPNMKAVYSHGLTREEATRRKEENPCAICGEDTVSKLRIDHDHKTMKVRGVLCNDCNLGLGRFKDSPERLSAAIVYLTGSKIPD